MVKSLFIGQHSIPFSDCFCNPVVRENFIFLKVNNIFFDKAVFVLIEQLKEGPFKICHQLIVREFRNHFMETITALARIIAIKWQILHLLNILAKSGYFIVGCIVYSKVCQCCIEEHFSLV